LIGKEDQQVKKKGVMTPLLDKMTCHQSTTLTHITSRIVINPNVSVLDNAHDKSVYGSNMLTNSPSGC